MMGVNQEKKASSEKKKLSRKEEGVMIYFQKGLLNRLSSPLGKK